MDLPFSISASFPQLAIVTGIPEIPPDQEETDAMVTQPMAEPKQGEKTETQITGFESRVGQAQSHHAAAQAFQGIGFDMERAVVNAHWATKRMSFIVLY